MREFFTAKRFGAEARAMIAKINGILSDYERQGYDLTLRQIYYQIVARDWFPDDRCWRNIGGDKWVRDPRGTKNATPNYKWLGDIVSDARLAGLVDWDMIRDRQRECSTIRHFSDPAEAVRATAKNFWLDMWEGQPNYVEVMVEKQALEGVLWPVCSDLDVPFTANKGYSSSSAMYEASKRFIDAHENGKSCFVLYLGDHDPSGIDMSRDVLDRLNLFTDSCGLEVQRLALNMDQVDELRPPENPAKITDSRAEGYISRFGRSSWELDAIEPARLASIVRGAIRSLIDEDVWREREDEQRDMKRELLRFAETYEGGSR